MKKTNLYAATALVGFAAANAQAQTIDYGMMESIFGEKVTASATGKPQRASETPVDMIIIGQDEIEKSGAQDIPQLLNKYAGMSVIRTGKHSADVNVRGYNSTYANKLLVLVNGRQIYQDAYGFTSWELLPVQLSEIRQIEVVKGPNTSLFGLNAESGVINIITYSPLKDDISVAEVKYGTQNTQAGGLVATTKLSEKLAARVSVEGKSSDEFRLHEDSDYDTDKGLTKHTYNVDTEYQIDPATNLRVQVGEAANRQVESIPYLLTTSGSEKRNRYLQATLNKDTEFGLIKANAYHNDSSAALSDFSYRNTLDVLQLENLKRLDKDNTVRTGVEYRESTVKGKGFGASEFSSKLLGFSGMWDHAVNDKLNLTNSLRFDHLETQATADQTSGNAYAKEAFAQNFDEISFNSGAVYKLSDLETLRFNAGRGVHLPSLAELGGNLSGPINFAGNPYLDPEVMWSAEAGYLRALPEVNGNFKSTVFYQYIEDYIAKTIPTVNQLSADNAGNSESIGLELSYDAKLNENIGYGSTYTFTYTKDHPNQDVMYNEDNNNQHKIAVWTDYSKDKWNAYAEAIWNSGVKYKSETLLYAADATVEEKIDSYITLNTNVSYDINENAKVSLAGYNLLDEHTEVPNGYNSTITSIYGGAELGRSALLSLKYKF